MLYNDLFAMSLKISNNWKLYYKKIYYVFSNELFNPYMYIRRVLVSFPQFPFHVSWIWEQVISVISNEKGNSIKNALRVNPCNLITFERIAIRKKWKETTQSVSAYSKSSDIQGWEWYTDIEKIIHKKTS